MVGGMDESPTYWYGAEKQALLGRLRRIEGQVRGVHRMVEQDTYCIDVLTQISAATKALQAVALGLLEGHLAHCVVEAGRAGEPHREGQGGRRRDRAAGPVLTRR
jgi:DNA-binding FrmR family transcriptional regulator